MHDYTFQLWMICIVGAFLVVVGGQVSAGLRERNRLLEMSNLMQAKQAEQAEAFQAKALQQANERTTDAVAATKELTAAISGIQDPATPDITTGFNRQEEGS